MGVFESPVDATVDEFSQEIRVCKQQIFEVYEIFRVSLVSVLWQIMQELVGSQRGTW